MTIRRVIQALTFATFALLGTTRVRAQVNGTTDGQPITSMGMPPVWKPYAGATATLGNTAHGTDAGSSALLGVYKDIANPLYGVLGLSAEAYAGGLAGKADGGARLFASAPVLYTQAGADWNAREGSMDFILSAIVPVHRGGFLVRGGLLRVDWIPGRGQSFNIGLQLPLFQPWVGKTRQKRLAVSLPEAPRRPETTTVRSTPALDSALAVVRREALVLTVFQTISFADHRSSYYDGLVRTAREMVAVRSLLHQVDSLHPHGHTFAVEDSLYHAWLDRALDIAAYGDVGAALDGSHPLGGSAGADGAESMHLGRRAEAIALEEVLLPYARTFGRYREHDTLLGFGSRAHERFARWMRDSSDVAPERQPLVLYAFDRWLDALEKIRRLFDDQTADDPRLVWLPPQLALRADQYDTQDEIDAIIGRAVQQPFTSGNAAIYLESQRVQYEIARMVRSAEDYHVLWIHDFAGLNHAGKPDRIGAAQTWNYLQTLTARVRDFDRTGKLPVYIIMVDHYFCESTKCGLWMRILERPLHASISLKGQSEMERDLRAAQDSLRHAVASSRRLQALARTHHDPEAWLDQVVKVHVNVTFPSDLTFRTARILGLPFAPDNIIVDHRKISFRDVTESDPSKGEGIYAGVGVGEHYASATWEDRAMLVSGPTLVTLKDAARETLLANGFTPEQIPPPLRPQPKPADYSERVRALERSGATGRAMDLHNQVGFARKNASIGQMLLYNLVPPGTVIVVPNSIWTDQLWAAQLTSAALRGCRVYVIAPALENHSAGSSMVLSRQQEVFSRFILAGEIFERELAASGGALHAGYYRRTQDLSQVADAMRHIVRTYRRYPFLLEDFPFSNSFFALMQRASDTLDWRQISGHQLVKDVKPRLPLLHAKSQFFASRDAIRALARSAASDSMLLALVSEAVTEPSYDVLRVPTAGRGERRAVLAPLVHASAALPDSVRARTIYYGTVGSLNKDARGVFLDGEAILLLSGEESLWLWPDTFYLLGSTVWLNRLEDADMLVPPQSRLTRWIARRIRRAL